MQNIGNNSSPSQFSNEGYLLCFLTSSIGSLPFECFPRCGTVGLFGKSQSTLWKREATSALLIIVLVLLDPQNQSSEVKDVVLIYKQNRDACTGFPCKLLTAVFPEFLAVI